MTTEKTKVCNTCRRELPLSEYNRSSSNPDGYQYACRECQHKLSRQHYEKKKAQQEEVKMTIENPLSRFKPRELIQELRDRGYKGKLTYTHTIEL